MKRYYVNMLKRPSFWILIGGFAGVLGTTVYISQNGLQYAHAAVSTSSQKSAAYITQHPFSALGNEDEEYVKLVEAVKPAVVHIEVGGRVAKSGEVIQQSQPSGSGVIVRADNSLGYGWVVTNQHVVHGHKKVTITLHDGRRVMGSVYTSKDPLVDVAVVKIDVKDLKALNFANSSNVKEGQMCLAIGSPMGLNHTVTYGKISSTHSRRESTQSLIDVIQTDASINPGNSGGPLIVLEKTKNGYTPGIAGINTFIATKSGGSQGLGFALKSNFVKLVSDILISKKKIQRGMIGIRPEDIKEYQKKELGREFGAVISDSVDKKSPAGKAGLKEGDIIIKIQDRTIKDAQDVVNALLEYGPGKNLNFVIIRNKKTHNISVKPISFQEHLKRMQKKQRYSNPQQEMLEELLRHFGMRGKGNFGFPGGPSPFDNFYDDEGDAEESDQDENIEESPDSNGSNSKEEQPKKSTERAKLGVKVADLNNSLRKSYYIPAKAKGALVTEVIPNTIASKYKFRVGDLITAIGNKKVTSSTDLLNGVKKLKAGEITRLKIVRYSKAGKQSVQWNIKF